MVKRGPDRKRKESYPAKAEAQRRRWADPEYRERVIGAMRATRATVESRARYSAGRIRSEPERKANPLKYGRHGIPTGYTRATAAAAWAEAAAKAAEVIRTLEAEGVLPRESSGDELDAALAKAGLHELVKLALGPGGKDVRLEAIRLVLTYTRCKPVERRNIQVEGLEAC